ncbi:MAG: 16S rRNA (uracil(1498)-N(3))-methyltransferase [Pseudomonadota bacterium]
MKARRLFVDETLASGNTLSLDGAAAHYLGRVLRARPGERVWLFNGDGREYQSTIDAISRRGVTVTVGPAIEGMAEPVRRIILAPALARHEKMDLVIQKACELGAHAVWPVATERSVTRLDTARAAKRSAHWRGVVIGATQQCGRSRLLDVAEPAALSDILARTVDSTVLIAQPDAPGTLVESLPPAEVTRTLVLLVGPEGGFAAEEQAAIRTAGGLGFRAGPRVLRTETASIALLAALQFAVGDWRY